MKYSTVQKGRSCDRRQMLHEVTATGIVLGLIPLAIGCGNQVDDKRDAPQGGEKVSASGESAENNGVSVGGSHQGEAQTPEPTPSGDPSEEGRRDDSASEATDEDENKNVEPPVDEGVQNEEEPDKPEDIEPTPTPAPPAPKGAKPYGFFSFGTPDITSEQIQAGEPFALPCDGGNHSLQITAEHLQLLAKGEEVEVTSTQSRHFFNPLPHRHVVVFKPKK